MEEKYSGDRWKYIPLTDEEYAKEMDISVAEYRAYSKWAWENDGYIEAHRTADGYLEPFTSWQIYKQENNLVF
jgi:hypothetical protein